MISHRIAERFALCARENRAAFVGYLMAADPDVETSFRCMKALIDGGADVIEIGAPFTDPMADGPSIQRAALRALKAGGSLSVALDLARRIRAEYPSLPIILMGYANPIHSMGWAAFAEAAGVAGIDGLITVDLPPEEDAPLRAELDKRGVATIRLATPTTTSARMVRVADGASGFLYYVSVTGVTGAGIGKMEDIAAGVNLARATSGLPVAVGFGVRTPDQAASFARIADGVVVGSALVEQINGAVEAEAPDAAVKAVSDVAIALSNAIASARLERSVP